MNHTFPKFGYNPVTGEWNDSLTGEFLWSNVNVSEAVPDVMTPSTWSLWWIYHYEANLFEFPGDYRFCGNICGRPYLNLSLIFSVYRAIGKDASKELQADAIGSAPLEFDIPTIRFSAFQVLRTMLPGLLRAQAQASRDQKATPEFLATTPDWCRSTRKTIQECLDLPDLLSLWQAEIKPTVLRACQMLRSVTMNMADPATKLRQQPVDPGWRSRRQCHPIQSIRGSGRPGEPWPFAGVGKSTGWPDERCGIPGALRASWSA